MKQDSRGNRHVRVECFHAGRRVYPSSLALWIDPSGVLHCIRAKWPTLPRIRTSKPQISSAAAVRSVAKLRDKAKLEGAVGEPQLEYHVVQRGRRTSVILAWSFVARFSGDGPSTEGFVVNAATGKLVRRYIDEDEVGATTTGIGINNTDETAASPVRTIDVDDPGGGADLTLLDTSRSVDIETRDMAGAEDAGGAYSLCADDHSDGEFTDLTNAPRTASDRTEVGAHFNTAVMHDYLARAVTVNGIALFGRTGWGNDAATKWISLVHKVKPGNVNSSAFSRTHQLTSHTDGDGVNMTYKPSLDTCTHEWAHAVQFNEVTGGISPSGGGLDGTAGENFVLKEAAADMFAGAVNREWGWHFAFAFEDDVALAGATHASTGGRLRGFQEPSAYTQPDHYYAGGDTLGLGYAGVTGTTQEKDYKRVGILDKAAYLIAAGGTHPSAGSDPATYPPIAVYGIGARCFENILYYVQTQLMGPADVFVDFRQEMIDAADALYPDDPCKAQTVARAFDAVGIYEEGDTPPALLGPDPMITPWGARTDHPPYWQSPDIYVKDAGGAIAPPLKGQMNRLVALVTNIGDVDAIGVDVAFSFKPYGMGTSGNAEKTIGTDNLDVAAGASVEVEIPWDLTNLADTNGGQWPLPLGNFDHFCVVVRLAHGPDVDTCNNAAQNNFGDVGSVEDGDGVSNFVIGNVEKRARWIALLPHHCIPADWSVELDLKNVFAGNASAARELAEIKDAEVPWVGAARDAIVIPMRGRESRAAQFRWKIRSREAYDGPIHGCLHGRAEGLAEITGKLLARVQYLALKGRRFRARIVGRIKTQSGNTVVRGELSGDVSPKTGKFGAAFSGLAGRRADDAKRTKFKVEGVMAASASISFAVVNGGDQQGIDLGVPIVGNSREVCGALRVPLARRKLRKRRDG